jgi:hypothetical protein
MMLTPASMRLGERRIVAVGCLLLSAAGIAIPFVGSLGMEVVLTIFPVSFGGTTCATNAAPANNLLRPEKQRIRFPVGDSRNQPRKPPQGMMCAQAIVTRRNVLNLEIDSGPVTPFASQTTSYPGRIHASPRNRQTITAIIVRIHFPETYQAQMQPPNKKRGEPVSPVIHRHASG